MKSLTMKSARQLLVALVYENRYSPQHAAGAEAESVAVALRRLLLVERQLVSQGGAVRRGIVGVGRNQFALSVCVRTKVNQGRALKMLRYRAACSTMGGFT